MKIKEIHTTEGFCVKKSYEIEWLYPQIIVLTESNRLLVKAINKDKWEDITPPCEEENE